MINCLAINLGVERSSVNVRNVLTAFDSRYSNPEKYERWICVKKTIKLIDTVLHRLGIATLNKKFKRKRV